MRRISNFVLMALLTGMIISCYSSAQAKGVNFFESQVVNRDVREVWSGIIPQKHTYRYPVYIISNIPEDEVMKPICRDTLLRMDGNSPHCKYISLHDIGSYKKGSLLPYDWRNGDCGTVIIIDRAKLTDTDRPLLSKLIKDVFPVAPSVAKSNEIVITAQCVGGMTMQVLLDIPDGKWLGEASDDLWSLPPQFVADRSKVSKNVIRAISKTAILTNDEQVQADLSQSLSSYCDKVVYSIDRYNEFLNDSGFDRRVIALNWNGPTEISSATAARLLPPEYREKCIDVTLDRMGLTGYQRFCREAFAKRSTVNTVEIWVMAAPTSGFLRQIAKQVATANFVGGPVKLDVCDLSRVNSIAIGVYVASKDPDRNRLVLQQELEDRASKLLRSKVNSMVTVQNWSPILSDVLGANPLADNPFGRPENVTRINQASKTDAVLLLWVKQIQPQVIYSVNKRRVTPPYPAFNISAPTQPGEPSPNEKPLFGSYKYPGTNYSERKKSTKYQGDWNTWKYTDMPKYNRDYEEWEQEQRQWASDRSDYQVNYVFDLTVTPSIKMSSYVKIIDQVANQNVLWTHDVDLAKSGDTVPKRSYPMTVHGEDTDCAQPDFGMNYQNAYAWRNCAEAVNDDQLYKISQSVINDSLDQALQRLSREALWANDLKPWNLSTEVTRLRE